MTAALLEQALAAKDAGKLNDQTADTGGFEYEPPAEGTTAARLVGYVEIGKRSQSYQGEEKPDALEAYLFFELLSKKHEKEIEVDGEKRTVYPVLREKMTIRAGEKANFVKLLKKMAYGRPITNMSLMLGEAFVLRVVHKKSEDGKKTYANIRTPEDGYLVSAPMYNANKDPLGEEDMQPLPVPEPTVPLKLLLWNNPTKEQWDSIFIDGTRTVKDEKGVSTEKSRNWLQDDIIHNAVDFEGSALQMLILELGGMSLDGGEAASSGPQNKATAKEKAKAVPKVKKDDKAAEEASEEEPGNDPLADLGLGV